MQGKESTDAIASVQAEVLDIEEHMLHFLENQLISGSPTMLYFAQDVGEPGDGDAGFGNPTRTTIFDYWGVPSHQRWMNGGAFDGGRLSDEEKDLRDFYRRLLSFSASSTALTGEYAEIHSFNRAGDNDAYNDKVFSFVRWKSDERLIVLSNFDPDTDYGVISAWQLGDGQYMLDEQLYRRNHAQLIVNDGEGLFRITLEPLGSAVLKVGAPNIHRSSV
jgi:hypothetical protein